VKKIQDEVDKLKLAMEAALKAASDDKENEDYKKAKLAYDTEVLKLVEPKSKASGTKATMM